MSKQPPRIPPAQPPLAAPRVDPAPGDPPDNLAAGLSLPVLAAAQAALPAGQRVKLTGPSPLQLTLTAATN